jgi:hypothetical protein
MPTAIIVRSLVHRALRWFGISQRVDRLGAALWSCPLRLHARKYFRVVYTQGANIAGGSQEFYLIDKTTDEQYGRPAGAPCSTSSDPFQLATLPTLMITIAEQ